MQKQQERKQNIRSDGDSKPRFGSGRGEKGQALQKELDKWVISKTLSVSKQTREESGRPII
jgi:hypothetical protein